MTNSRIIKIALAVIGFCIFALMLGGPLKSWLPECRDTFIGFCVKR